MSDEVLSGPYLLAALLISDMRRGVAREVHDLCGIHAGIEVPYDQALPFHARLVLFVRLVPGDHAEAAVLTLACAGLEIDEMATLPAAGRHPDKPIDLTAVLSARVTGPGLQWLDLRLDGRLLTKVPIRVGVPPRLE